jgi:hypothetical protein
MSEEEKHLDPYACESRDIPYECYRRAEEVIDEVGWLHPYRCEAKGIPYSEYSKMRAMLED